MIDYGRIHIGSMVGSPWLYKIGRSLQTKSMEHLLIRCCVFESNVKIRSPKCENNIMKNMKLVMS
jgi:hypothetical protein